MFRFTQGRVAIRGPSHQITYEQLWIRGNGHNMTITALSGYISTLFLTHYGKEHTINPQIANQSFLMDSGCVVDYELVQAAVQHLKLPPLNLVVATHCHPDHMGAASRFQQNRIKTVCPEGINKWYDGKGGYVQCKMDTMLASFVGYRLGRGIRSVSFPRAHTPDVWLWEGSSIGQFDDWTALHVPGHTSHMISLWHAASGVLYTSDLLVNHRGEEFWSPIPVDFPGVYMKTLNRLRDLPVRYLCMSHGGIIDVTETPGGWITILDEVKYHAQRLPNKVMVKIIKDCVVGYNAECKGPEGGEGTVEVPRYPMSRYGAPDPHVCIMHIK
eukprot:PhF_6_TR35792/c0_g1_i1/m.52021